MNKQNTIITMVILVLVVGGGAFYGGMKYGQSTASKSSNQVAGARQFGANGTGARMRGGANGGGFITGDVIKQDANSVTVQLATGGTKIIFITDKTTIVKSTPGAITDLAVGKRVSANGTNNPDGSIAAQQIQIRPADAGIPGGPGGQGQGQQGGPAGNLPAQGQQGQPPIPGSTPNGQ